MKTATLLVSALLLSLSAAASDFYVARTGTASGDGSIDRPWDLATALNQPSSVKPGDTIWVRQGSYVGHFTSALKGGPNKPVVLRAYPGERATIDGNYGGNAPTFVINGADAWYWGLEVTNSDPARSTTNSGNTPPDRRGEGVQLLGPRTRLINVAIHDTGQGVLSTAASPDAEIYGSLIYYNGWDNPTRGSGHGVYVQNDTGGKRIVDNMIFDQFGWGVHAYTEGGQLNGLYFEGNTCFDNGALSQVSGLTTDMLIGANGSAASGPDDSLKVAKRTVLIANYTYFSRSGGVGANLGYSKGIASPRITDNVFVGDPALELVNAFRPISMTGNTIYGAISGFGAAEFPGNTLLTSRPTGVKVFIRPNQYEPGRAHVTVYNWDRAATVDIDPRGVLRPGTAYELRNAQNYFGAAVLAGTYDGTPLHVPMTGLAASAPVGRAAAPANTGPDFQVFVLVPKPPATNAKRPVASFSLSPRAPVSGEAIEFSDQSRGSFTSRSWDFGDPSSGSANGSALSQPTHTYGAPGTYTVSLTLESDGGSSARSRDVVVTGSPGTSAATLPVAGHVAGATGTFVTDIFVENPTPSPLEATLVFSPSGGGLPLQTPLSLAAGEARSIPDVVTAEFGATNAIGSLRAEAAGAPPPPLRIAGRTYVQKGDGTLGFGASALSAADAVGGERTLSNLTVSDAFHTNVGALNPSDSAQSFSLEIADGNGNILGRATLGLAAGEQRQWSLSDLFPAVTGSGLTARLTPAVGAVAPMAYAAVTDNLSSDPTYYSAVAPGPTQYVPGIAGVTGVGGARFRSEISIANSGQGPATVDVTFLEHDRNNGSGAPTAVLVLGPRETLHADDALSTLFGIEESYGALRIEADGSPGVSVFERILTDATTSSGTVGQQLEAVSSEILSPRGALLGLRHGTAFRCNVAFVNPDAGVARISLRLRSSHEILGSAEVALPPGGYTQRSLPAFFPGSQVPDGEPLTLDVDGGADPVLAFASVIDNLSQDPTCLTELP